MRIQLVTKTTRDGTGTSRYAKDLMHGLQNFGIDVVLGQPKMSPLFKIAEKGGRRLGFDLNAFYASYPLRAHLEPADLYLITTQTMATMLHFQRFPAPVIVSVLDIIPYIVRHDPVLNTLNHSADRFFYKLALSGLHRADALIAISEYTKKTLVEYLHIPAEKIYVVYPGVDGTHFRPLEVSEKFRQQYSIPAEQKYILYVGSEDPRKNLSTLFRAFAQVIERVPNARLLKIGRAQFPEERQRLLQLSAELHIDEKVTFFDYVTDDDLPVFYNAADVVVMPSLYEGFGYPAIEAMACGTPAIVADATSLPELLHDKSLTVPASDIAMMSAAIVRQITDNHQQAEYWIRQAERFSIAAMTKHLTQVFDSTLAASSIRRNV